MPYEIDIMNKLNKTLNWRAQPDLPKLEESVLEHWQENRVFEKSVSARPKDKQYVFYDGPPFATGMPHYGHLLGSTSKDVVGRYWTMKGFRVERIWGWDCHGLPIENMIEKQLDIKQGKKGIEALGVGKFNQACRTEVMRLDKEWERIIARLGRWVDFENNYKTMDFNYMESVWWAFSQLFKKGFVYQGKKVILYCPRCATPLSNFEIAMDNSYEMVTDPSVTIKFKVANSKNKYLLAWTTTPWTLTGNVALAVNPKEKYDLVELDNVQYWLAKNRTQAVFGTQKLKILRSVKGKELVGTKFEPLYPYLLPHITPKAWTVLEADFVSLEDGTGIVHTAAMFGEDDFALALQQNLPMIQSLDEEGKFLPFIQIVAGQFYKKADPIIIEDLKTRQLMFNHTTLEHSYPFCYRCHTPLYYNAVPAWFINIQKLKPQLINHNQSMNWYPKHLKDGRFGQGLAMAPDWNISRSRYWGTPMPIWEETAKPNQVPRRRIIESLAELKKWAVNPSLVANLTDIHREHIDHIEVWIDDTKTVKGKRIREVFDCWVESGSMPFASRHYPFENQTEFEKTYPAQFVSEYIAQTRAWFYTMHVMSVALFDQHAVENTLTTGTIMAANGDKMSKSKKNYPDPMDIINQTGVDSLRLYLMSSPVMRGENINFLEKEINEIRKQIFLIWWNVTAFYQMFAGEYQLDPNAEVKATNVMDKWLLSRLNRLIDNVTHAMDCYDLVTASRLLMSFISELSNWYLRRSRDRFKDPQLVQESLQVLASVLYKLAQLFAPFAPFFSELIFSIFNTDQLSVHLTDWPQVDKKMIDDQLDQDMETVRKVAEKAHALRKLTNMKVRQPLAKAIVTGARQPSAALADVLKDEINVKLITWRANKSNTSKLEVELDTQLTPDLVAEGEARELIRNIQKLRKATDVEAKTPITVSAPSWPASWQKTIEQKTNSILTHGDSLTIADNSAPLT